MAVAIGLLLVAASLLGSSSASNELKLPFLSSYLDAIDSNFRYRANFASSGSTIQPADAKNLDFMDRLPRLEEFSKALYILDCGQNDLCYGLATTTEEQVKASIPDIISRLFQQGARFFWIHNTGPLGCLPILVLSSPPKPGNADQTGCIKSYNELAQEFNKQLKDRVSQLRTQLHGARLIYVDIYSAKYSLISEANKYGFVDPFIHCCGDDRVMCRRTAAVKGTEIFGAPCSDPSKHISWDGVHYTEAANYWVANRILDGSLPLFQTPTAYNQSVSISSYYFYKLTHINPSQLNTHPK
ncbi:hypothetical protein V6N13_108068 [Hibiscus sabdariffa]|uniref:GDSL esterase/lipase n=1 Tax=Hibiscus sabdariffa TaxID=183260 RepID=A0ABR2SR37_9ROSI